MHILCPPRLLNISEVNLNGFIDFSVTGPNSGMLISRQTKRGGILAIFDYFNQKKDDLLHRNKQF